MRWCVIVCCSGCVVTMCLCVHLYKLGLAKITIFLSIWQWYNYSCHAMLVYLHVKVLHILCICTSIYLSCEFGCNCFWLCICLSPFPCDEVLWIWPMAGTYLCAGCFSSEWCGECGSLFFWEGDHVWLSLVTYAHACMCVLHASFFLVPHKHADAWSRLGCARQGGARYAQLCWWVQWG